jgi:hypothetical protein
METSQESGHATTRHASLFRGFFHVRVLASGAIPSVSGSEPAQNKFRGISNHMKLSGSFSRLTPQFVPT